MALMEAYARRLQWQAKVQATETVRALAGALGGETTAPEGARRVSADQLLGQMGVGF